MPVGPLRTALNLACGLTLLASRAQLARAEPPSAAGPSSAVAAAPAPATAAAPESPTPARPPVGDAEVGARTLFDAIVHDDPARATDFFFPRDAFLQVKAMAHPERYYDRLRARFEQDIHALHATTPELSRAVFERLELVKRGGYVRVGEEGNRLPYWASRHSFLHYRVDGKPKKLELRVLITWQERWYLIHLSEFH